MLIEISKKWQRFVTLQGIYCGVSKASTYSLRLPTLPLRAFFAAFSTWTQRPQIVPVVNSVIVTVFPDNAQRVGADCDHICQTGGEGIFHLPAEYFCIRFRFHVLMSAAAGGAWTGGA